MLTRPALRFDISFAHRRDLFWLVAVAAASSAFVALAYVGLVVALGFLDAQRFALRRVALLDRRHDRHHGGDAIHPDPVHAPAHPRRHLGGARSAGADCRGAVAHRCATSSWCIFHLFYLLFIPVIWSAIRFGLEGVVFGLAVTQIGLIAAIHLSPSDAIDVTAFQALMIVLAVTGLAVGLLVNEQQRTEQQLRVQQDAIARVIRVGSMGEFAAALAHEINQPLMAIANYTKLAKEVAEKTPADTATVAEASAQGRRTGRARRRGGAPAARVHPSRPQRGGRGTCSRR